MEKPMDKQFDELSKSPIYCKWRRLARRGFCFTLAGLAMLCISALQHATAQTYSITDLNRAQANGINASGQVVS